MRPLVAYQLRSILRPPPVCHLQTTPSTVPWCAAAPFLLVMSRWKLLFNWLRGQRRLWLFAVRRKVLRLQYGSRNQSEKPGLVRHLKTFWPHLRPKPHLRNQIAPSASRHLADTKGSCILAAECTANQLIRICVVRQRLAPANRLFTLKWV